MDTPDVMVHDANAWIDFEELCRRPDLSEVLIRRDLSDYRVSVRREKIPHVIVARGNTVEAAIAALREELDG